MVSGENAMVVPSEPLCPLDEVKVLCIIRDMTNTEVQSRLPLKYPISMTCHEVIVEVAKQFGYEPYTFLLTYERPDESGTYTEVVLNECRSMKLGEVCANCGTQKRNNFNLMEKDGPPVKIAMSDQSVTLSSDLPGSTLDVRSQSLPDAVYSSSTVYGPNLSTSATDYSFMSGTGYVGLVNQAMTCYLSSLLQTLFMTPEFRNAVYRWQFKGTEEEAAKSIPYQLQRLFLLLQTSKRRAVETTDITRSFGWDSSEAWQQHDVQELCRVMFDALEKTWGKTDQGNLINELYQGKMKDYVKCLECGHESARTDIYLDIPLVIRPFGSSTSYSSVEQALSAFVEPEILDGNNQYFCERCGKKCNAHKGLKFLSFPYLLTLQLKRFDFDYVSMQRIKLNDRMTFPYVLSLNELIEGATDDAVPSTDSNDLGSEADYSNRHLENSAGDASSPGLQQDDPDEACSLIPGIDEGIDIGCSASGPSTTSSDVSSLNSTEAAANDRNMKEVKGQGPYVYELFSIMIHSGSAAGGHYYAYIRSFEDDQWYSFNDQNVSAITRDDIRKIYGGSSTSRGFYSSAYTSSTNAYMLMYRQMNKERNAKFYKVEDFPEHLKAELSKMKEKEEAERKQREHDRNLCKIPVFCYHPIQNKRVEHRLIVHKDKTLQEATEIAWQLFDLEKVIPLDCCRLIKYDEALDYIDQSYDGKDNVPMGELLGGVKLSYAYDLLLEVKQPGEVFEEYRPGGVMVKVMLVDLEKETVTPAVTHRAYLTDTVEDFLTNISNILEIPCNVVRCVREHYYNDLQLLTKRAATLKDAGFTKCSKVFIEYSGLEDDNQIIFQDTRLYSLLDRYENTIRLRISLPPYIQENNKKTSDVSTTKDNIMDADMSHDIDEGIDETDQLSSESSLPSTATGVDDIRGSSVSFPNDVCTNHSHPAGVSNHERAAPDGQENPADGSQVITGASTSSVQNSLSEEASKGVSADGTENWDLDDNVGSDWDGQVSGQHKECPRYFRAELQTNMDKTERTLIVEVDKRITLSSLKKELQQYVGTTADHFKVFRVYSNCQEVEVSRLSETLSTYNDDSKLIVKLGRALRKGEYRVKVYLLQINKEEVIKFLVEAILANGMTVLESKKVILKELKRECNMDVPLDRCRLRRKPWKNPTKIYQNDQVYGKDITLMANWEVFLEILDGPDPVTDSSMLSLYVRRWNPSTYTVDPLKEVILTVQTVDELRQKLSSLSGIPVENIEFAKAKGTFPYEISLLEVHTEMDWNVSVSALNMYPLSICEDGAVIYYRDKTEKLMELSEAKKKELQQKENARLSQSSHCHYTPRKERALKIYTDDSTSQSANSISTSNRISSVQSVITSSSSSLNSHPELD